MFTISFQNGCLKGENAEEHASTDVAESSGVVTEAICSEVVKHGLEISNPGSCLLTVLLVIFRNVFWKM